MIYVVFQLVYILGFDGQDSQGNDWIYPILDWKNNPGEATGWVVGVIIMLVFTTGILCLIAFIRDLLWEKLIGHSQKETVRLNLENPSNSHNSSKNYDTMQQ